MIKRAKKGQKKERWQSNDDCQIGTMPLIFSSYAIITEIEDTKKIVEKLRLQYQEEYEKLHYCDIKK